MMLNDTAAGNQTGENVSLSRSLHWCNLYNDLLYVYLPVRAETNIQIVHLSGSYLNTKMFYWIANERLFCINSITLLRFCVSSKMSDIHFSPI